MPTDYYRHIQVRFVLSVTAVVLVLSGLFYWYGAREYELVLSSAEKRSASMSMPSRSMPSGSLRRPIAPLKLWLRRLEKTVESTYARVVTSNKVLAEGVRVNYNSAQFTYCKLHRGYRAPTQ